MHVQALLADLDADQRRAVTAESQLVAVIAGAGSGKTRVLTRRAAYRVLTGTADEAHTLVLTFTREAAGELRRRLPTLGLAGRLTTGTFHAVAYSVLQQRWRDLDQRPRTVTADRRRHIARLARAGADPEALADEVEFAASRGWSAAAYEAAVRRGEHRPRIDAGLVMATIERYRHDKRERGVVDLDDLLALTIEAIEHDGGFADAVRWRFRHLLVDEAQDLNPLQHRLLDLLRAGRDDVFLVGDPAQAIYGFTGADPGLLLDVSDRFPGVEVIRLPVNHRCTPQIVDAGLYALDRGGQPADLRSARDDGRVVTAEQHADETDETRSVVRQIAAADRGLIGTSQVAVLARTHAQLGPLSTALERAGLAVRHRLQRSGTPLDTVLSNVTRLADPAALRRWAQDALELDHAGQPLAGEAERDVGQAVIEFLRSEPVGDGATFRAWIDANDVFGRTAAGVELLTFHAAKGREWHTVHLVGCETSLVPHRSATTNAARAEEARLLYVALTRATDVLHIHWALRRNGYQRRRTPLLDGFESCTPPTVPPPAGIAHPVSDRAVRLGRLRQWRADTAKAAGIVPESVCSDATLAAIADAEPSTADQLDAVTGLGAITSRRLWPGIADALAGQVRSTITGA
jgi:DNA helicase-2/ATP-dependent DNA helicase PcrA